jgi:hypothetical protein
MGLATFPGLSTAIENGNIVVGWKNRPKDRPSTADTSVTNKVTKKKGGGGDEHIEDCDRTRNGVMMNVHIISGNYECTHPM